MTHLDVPAGGRLTYEQFRATRVGRLKTDVPFPFEIDLRRIVEL